MPGEKGERKRFQELPTARTGLGGGGSSILLYQQSALKFPEQGLVQRRVRDWLHRLFLLCWEVPGPKPRPPASGLLHQAQGSPTQGCPALGTGGWASKTQDSAWQTLEGGKEGHQGGGKQAVGLEESPPARDLGMWVQMDSYETKRFPNTPLASY